MDLKEELTSLFAANVPLVNLVTYEEERMTRLIKEATDKAGFGVYTWDWQDGFTAVREGRPVLPRKELTTDSVLKHLAEQMPPKTVVILKDFHHAWKEKKANTTRKLRNMAPALREKNQFLVFTTPMLELPAELKDDVLVVHAPLPDGMAMAALFMEWTRDLQKSQLPDAQLRGKLVSSALGLTTNQALRAFTRVYAKYGKFDEQAIDLITSVKREVVKESGALEFLPAEKGESSVGGLDLMKGWMKKRELAFSDEARQSKLPFPRGMALIGIPGTGKSLSAKMASGLWKMPLLRLDMGAVFESLLGESEKHMRHAIMLAETVSPCILWIDEMEKAFAGSSAGALNAGAATRVFGSFLTWMQEHQSPVFVIATANEVGVLPPELMGRFDRTFFLDLPNSIERKAIFLIHLEHAGVTFPERSFFRTDELVLKSKGFVGREIERVVHEAQFTAFADHNRQIEMRDLLDAMAEVVPLSKSHAEVIDDLRRWLTEGRAFPASSEEPPPAAPGGRKIVME